MSEREKQIEEGILIGNQIDKSNLQNPISRKLVQGFDHALWDALDSLAPETIHEVGCGEGRVTKMMEERFQIEVLGTDFSRQLIARNKQLENERLRFEQKSIYDLSPEVDRRDLIVCCEVLEHLEYPEVGVRKLCEVGARKYVISVPREPIWRTLNMLRGKYLRDWGNTPGHLNHWSKSSFEKLLLDSGLKVERWLNPFPWLMVIARPLKNR